MIKTKSLIAIEHIPHTWIFEHYLKLSTKLTGQDVKIKSAFTSHDTNPSMYVFYKEGQYYYKDFSTDRGGDAIDLVLNLYPMELYTRYDACIKISEDYAKDQNHTAEEIIKKPKFKIEDIELRNWIKQDAKYWTRYNISSELLNKYNVHPIKNYTFRQHLPDKVKEFSISKTYLYGFFNGSQDFSGLYKIYRPYCKDGKFFLIKHGIQGLRYLSVKKPNLIIHSSLKDLMSFESLNWSNIDNIEAESESVLISKDIMSILKVKYNKIITLFDNDDAGRKAIKRYQEIYNVPGFFLSMSKDISDSVKDYGVNKVKQELYNELKKLL